MLKRIVRWAAVISTTAAAAFLTFVVLLRLDPPGWESREYGAIAFWSLPLGGLVLVGAKMIRRFTGRPWLFRTLAVVITVAITIIWTFIAVALTGGYALAFDANPLYCWLIGAAAGMAVDVNWPQLPARDQHAA